MALPSRWTRTGKYIGDSAIKCSNSPQSFDPSVIFTFRENHIRLTPFSVDRSSFLSSSACFASHNTRNRVRRSVERVEFKDDSRNSPHKVPNLSFKSVFGRRFLWRRTLLASSKVRSIILLNILTVVYASNIPVVKGVEAIMDPAAFTVVRFVLSAIPFIPFVVQARGDTQIRNAGIELGFWVSSGYLMQALGLLTSDAGRATFISTFTVIVVPLLDGMLGAIIPARTWFGALMSIIGVCMLEASGSPPSIGDLLNFLSAVFFGIHMLRTQHISRSTDKENFLPVLGYEVCVVALLSTLWYFLGGTLSGNLESIPSSWTWEMFWNWMVLFPWIPALYTGVFSTGFCSWVEMAAMRDVSATETAIIYSLEPVWGAGFAWFLLNERWDMTGWFGAALVLGGSLMVQVLGSSSSNLPSNGKDSEPADRLAVSNKKSGLSGSPIIVNSPEHVP